MKRVDREGPIHRAIVEYLRTVLPAALVHHSPNEIGLSGADVARQIAKAKTNGMVPGWPDIEVMAPEGPMFFEVKAPGGTTTAAQDGVLGRLEAMGYQVAVVRSVADVRAALAMWGITTRERQG